MTGNPLLSAPRSVEEHAARNNFWRRWRLERRVATTLYLTYTACTVTHPVAGEYLFVLGLAVAFATSAKVRGLPKRLIYRYRLRPTQRVFDWALKSESPYLYEIHPAAIGTTITARVNLGSNCERLAKHCLTMAAALEAREVRLTQRRENAAIADLLVVTEETLERQVEPERLLSAYRPNLYDCVPLGLDENGDDVVIGLVGRHLLIGGEPGAGKSGTLSVVLAAAARDPNCDIWCFDGKLVELAAWKPVATRMVGAYMADANEALDELRAEMDRRYEGLLATNRRKVVEGDPERTLVVVIDELAFYVSNGDKKAAQAFSEKLRDLVARARAAGIVVVAATQKPSADLIPTALRDNFAYRLAHRCATREASDTILGSGWAALEVSASSIDPKLRGLGYLIDDGGVPKRIRTMLLSDAAIGEVVADAVRIREGTR